MLPEQIFMALLFVVLITLLIQSRFQPSWVFGVAALLCYAAGLVDTNEVLQKFSNIGLVTLLLLLLVSVGLEKVDWLVDISRRLVKRNYLFTLLRVGGVTAFLSAFLNNTAVVAVLANGLQKNTRHLPSRLLIPLSYAAILGGTTTLIGTSTNLVVDSFLIDAGEPGLEFFDFLLVGAAATVVGMLVLLVSAQFLPSYKQASMPVEQYSIEAKVPEGSPLIGKSVSENNLRNLESLFLVELIRGRQKLSPVSPYQHLEAGDTLIFSGDVKQLGRIEAIDGLESFATSSGLLDSNIVEVIVLPNATVVGRTIKNVGFRAMFDAAVVGMQRSGKRVSGKLGSIELRPGDTLLLAVGPEFSERQNISKNFAVLSGQEIERQLSKRAASIMLGAFALVVVLAATSVVPLIQGLIFLLAGQMAFKIVSGEELKRRFPYDLMIIIASALILARALDNSGLVDIIAHWLHENLNTQGPVVALMGVFIATLIMTEIMTNNAAAALAFPIAFTLAESFGVHYMPFVMAVAYGASASFMTPYGYTTNLIVQNMGGYEFKDYVRTGFPVAIAYSATVLFMLPIAFPF